MKQAERAVKHRRHKICLTCHWLRMLDTPTDDWDGKACAYTFETGRFRETPATDGYCPCYRRKKAKK